MIASDGIEKLCHDLNLSIEALEVLGLMYVCKCTSYGFISMSEFNAGMKNLGISSFTDLTNKCADKLGAIVKESSKDFWSFYQFLFKFHAEGKKFIQTEIAS